MKTSEVRAADSDNEWKCGGCSEMMGPSASKFCSKCAADGDEDDDEEESKALGLDQKSTRAQRLTRMTELSAMSLQFITATGTKTSAEAIGKVAASLDAVTKLEAAQAEIGKARAESMRRDLRVALEAGLAGQRLSLGAIQKSIPLVLRGEQKTAWCAAMDGIKTVTKDAVLDAACSVALSADDVLAIAEFAKSSSPIAAKPFEEPIRDTKAESEALDATALEVKKHADAARATLDRGKKSAAAKK